MVDKNNFEKLKVWQLAHQLVLDIYKISSRFPQNEKFRLTDQLCRSASSVPANIVEGNSRKHNKEYIQFLNTAYASLEETKYHLLLAKDLDYLKPSDYSRLIDQATVVSRMLNSLRKYLLGKKSII